MKDQKQLVKMANRLLVVLNELAMSRLKQMQTEFCDVGLKCLEIGKIANQLNRSMTKGWFSAARRLLEAAERDLKDLDKHIGRFEDMRRCKHDLCVPTFSDIFWELVGICDEFDIFSFNLAQGTISVVTEPIVLEDISFGPFEIKLFVDDFSNLHTERPYRVIALEPNPAGTDRNVTHPHVASNRLCEGDGCVAIGKALEQGRLYDFFTMVIGVLKTYNADSAWVSLSDWDGYSCYDCGSSIRTNDSYFCQSCENDYCENCSTYCQKCDSTVCLGCSFVCPNCDEPVCRRCTAQCSECNNTFCKDCLNDNVCGNCEQLLKENEDEEESQPETFPAVQPDSMG